MKKVMLLLFILILAIPAGVSIEIITGEAITGKASSQPVHVSIFIWPSVAPTLTIISPKNMTYLTDTSILLNYSVVSAENLWYRLDNSGSTITITSPVYFNTSSGSRTLFLYASNSVGITMRSITFSVNLTKFIINYTDWRSSFRGNSTDFYSYTYEDLQNLSNIIFEHINYGKIRLLQAVNLTNDLNSSDNLLDLDHNIDISFNRIELNSIALPNFNVSASLSLYNLTFTNPRILRDGIICPASICTFESYSSGVLRFNVTGFSVYSAEETLQPAYAPDGGGGGGISRADFSISPDNIRIKLKQGETKRESLTIKNTGDRRIRISLQGLLIGDFVRLSETEFELNPNEVKTIFIDIIAREDSAPNLYLGKLVVESEGIKKDVLMAIEIESREHLLDVQLRILEESLHVLPGEELLSEVSIYNLGSRRRVDITLDYTIKNYEGNTILIEHETMAVETRVSFLKRFALPRDAEEGKYNLYVGATYNGYVASASAEFTVEAPLLAPLEIKNLVIIIIIIIIAIIILIIILFYLARKHAEEARKIDEKILLKEKLIKPKGG